jgi:hypothetical protein
MRRYLFSLLMIAAGLTADAQNLLQTQPAASPAFPAPANRSAFQAWPERSLTKFRVSSYVGRWDGMPIAYQRLQLGSFDLQIPVSSLNDWIVENTGSYSFNLKHRWATEARAYFAWFPRGTFLSDISDAAWLTYVSSIPRTSALSSRQAVRIIDDDSATNPAMVRILNSRIRVLVYDEVDPKTGEKAQSTLQIFSEQPDGILVMGLNGPSKSVYESSASFVRLLLNVMPFDPTR